jgi:parallel beta-helix repeat protein
VKLSASALVLLLAVSVVVVYVPQIKTVKAAAGAAIYILEDGSILGTSNIQKYGNTYRFIGDINSGNSPYGISIEKDNIVLDGGGRTLQGNYNTSQPNSGVSLTGLHVRASYVTIKNLNIENYRDGIQQYDVSNNIILDNNITFCSTGIFFSDSPHNMLRSNRLANNVQHLRISVDKLGQFPNDIDMSNTVDGKPIIYWVQKSHSTVPDVAGLVFLVDCTEIAVQNLNLSGNGQTIFLHSTTDSTIQHSLLLGNKVDTGIYLFNSSNIQLIENTIENQSIGIYLRDSSNSHISQNQMANNSIGIQLQNANNNKIIGNTFSENGDCIYFNVFWGSPTPSVGNTISDNELADNHGGMNVAGENLVKGNVVTGNSGTAIKVANQVTLLDNVVADSKYGIDVVGQDNVLRNNTITDNTYNLFVSGLHKNYWRGAYVGVLVNDIDSSNTVNGRPVYYWVGKHDKTVPSDAGYVMLVNCDNITVQKQNLCSNGEGIVLLNTTNSRVSGNTVSCNIIGVGIFLSKQNLISENFIRNNDDGIRIDSINNTITANNITLNKIWAINFKGNQANNTIYCNNFIDNANSTLQISINKLYGLGLGNFWDNGTLGNYWSDYLQRYPNATKIRSTSVGNTPFYINENNIDFHPLMEPLTIPEFPQWFILHLIIAATLLIVICKRKLPKNR